MLSRMEPIVPEAIQRYADRHSSPEPALFAELGAETRAHTKQPQMMVGHAQGTFLRSLVRMSGARTVLEIGTFTGYSAMAMAEGLPPDGRLITCDIDPVATAIARRFWARHPAGARIELRLGPALDTLASLAGPLDLVFIDADKRAYIRYWEACVPLLRPGGVILADNVLWSGKILDPQDDDTLAIDAFNRHVAGDTRMETVMLTIRDGVTLAMKRA